jgi:hypothetical protein
VKKIFILFLLLVIACGPSETEIQTRVDNAVKEALASTTTSPSTSVRPSPTTSSVSTLSEYEKCRNNVQALLRIYTEGSWGRGEYYKIPQAYYDFGTALTSSSYNLDDIEAERAWIDLTNSLEVVLTAKDNLPKPENRTTYQEYYFTFEKLINTWVNTYGLWLSLKSGIPDEEYSQKINQNLELIENLENEIYQITYCRE